MTADTPSKRAQRWTIIANGQRIRELRHQCGLAQAGLAGVSLDTVARLERQHRTTCRTRTLARIAAALGEPPATMVLAATYHQVWWPPTQSVRFHDGELPVWHEASGNYLDPATGEVLPTWDEALDAIGAGDEPQHVARFGERFDAQGVLAGSRDANRCIGYLTKYLT
jgi:transcriptional regulator with XRE-family HTH domain